MSWNNLLPDVACDGRIIRRGQHSLGLFVVSGNVRLEHLSIKSSSRGLYSDIVS
jgi:hypothetical protein